MNEKMEDNIQNINNTQFFSDCYYAIPPFNKGAKLWILLAFNNTLMKTLLCTISLIKNENKETVTALLDYLHLKYNFQPKKITLDFGRDPISAFKNKYPNCTIVPCFFHFLQRIIKHLT